MPLPGSHEWINMKDRLSEILGLTSKPAGVKRETGNGWSSRDPSRESIAEIQINPPIFGPETEARLEQSRGMIQEEAIAAFRRAGAYFAAKNYGRAISDYTRAIEHSPRSPEGYYNRGITHEKAGKFEKAIEDYTDAIVGRPAVCEGILQSGIPALEPGGDGAGRRRHEKGGAAGDEGDAGVSQIKRHRLVVPRERQASGIRTR